MAADVEIEFDKAKLRRVQSLMREVPEKMPTAMSRAINRTAKSARAEMVRRMAGDVNIVQKSIRSSIKLTKASKNKWIAELGISGRRISLISFKGTSQTKKGIAYRIKTGGARKLVPSAFIGTPRRTGIKGVLKRMTPRRYPLAWLRGPSLPYVFERAPGVAAAVIKNTHKKLEANIDAQVKFILQKQRAG